MQTTETLPVTEPYVLTDYDARGVVRLTLNRPRQFNALSEEMLAALQAELDAIAANPQVRVVVIAGQGKAFCAGHDLKQMRANPSQAYYEDPVCALLAHDDDDPAPAATRDRPRPRHRHSRRMPAGRHVRPGGRFRRCNIRRFRHQRRIVLLDPGGGVVTQHRAQSRLRDAGHRRLYRRPHCTGAWAGQSCRSRRRSRR
jgi:hypothetical protein